MTSMNLTSLHYFRQRALARRRFAIRDFDDAC
jgi:hypothetical protein